MRISELVALARDGRLRVPGFQRGFRWDAGDVLELFDSVWRGFPVGSLLLWQRPAPETVLTFGHVTVDAPASDEALWVVDGQHRLTAFVAVLSPEGSSGGPFELYFDLESEVLRRRPGPGQVPPTWLPLSGLLDQNGLFARLLALKGDGMLNDEETDRAVDFANRVRDYELPLSIVKTNEEEVVRRIFDRLNSSGKRLKASEVFRSLHAAADQEEGTDLREVVETIGAAGFGQIGADTVLRCVLAARGGAIRTATSARSSVMPRSCATASARGPRPFSGHFRSLSVTRGFHTAAHCPTRRRFQSLRGSSLDSPNRPTRLASSCVAGCGVALSRGAAAAMWRSCVGPCRASARTRPRRPSRFSQP